MRLQALKGVNKSYILYELVIAKEVDAFFT